MKGKTPSHPLLEAVAKDCLAVRLRMLHRIVNSIYDRRLRPYGLRIGQLNLLVLLAREAGQRLTQVSRTLKMDKSTLSRDIEVLRKRGWLTLSEGQDARTKDLNVTRAGFALLLRVEAAWAKAQAESLKLLGKDGVAAIALMAETIWKEELTRSKEDRPLLRQRRFKLNTGFKEKP